MAADQPLDYTEQRVNLDEFEDDLLVSFPNKPNKTFEKALEGARKDVVFIDLTNNRLVKLEGLEEFTQLRRLDLRNNQIETIENLDHLTLLEELDLYENQLSHIGGLIFPNLRYLDLSFNQIRALGENPFAQLPKLLEVYLVQNKIKHIGEGALDCLAGSLVTLELGANRIKKIENLDKLANLRHLWLGKNKISQIENLSALTNLRVLSLQRNRLTKISTGLENLKRLEELYLSENGIEEVENLSGLTSLKILDVGRNRIQKVDHVVCLKESLDELWLNNNQIENVVDLEFVKELTKLKTLYVEFNPLTQDTQHRKKLADFCPSLEQIDASLVISDSERKDFMDNMKVGKVIKKT